MRLTGFWFLIFLNGVATVSSVVATETKYRPQDYYDCVDQLFIEPSRVDSHRALFENDKIFVLNQRATYFFERTELTQFGVREGAIQIAGNSLPVLIKNFAVMAGENEIFVHAYKNRPQLLKTFGGSSFIDPVDQRTLTVQLLNHLEGEYQTVTPKILTPGSSSPSLNLWIIKSIPMSLRYLAQLQKQELSNNLDTQSVLRQFTSKINDIERSCRALGSLQIDAAIMEAGVEWEVARMKATMELKEPF